MKRHAITIIGTGLNANADASADAPVSWKAHPALSGADAVIGGRRLLESLGDIPARKIALGKDIAAVLDEAETMIAAGKRVAALATGDPLFFGLGAAFAERFGPENVRIYPAVSSLQEAAARLALPWDSVKTISLHGRDSFLPLGHALLTGAPVCVLTDKIHTPGRIASYMKERGRTNYTAAVFAQLGTPEESLWRGSPEEMECSAFPDPNIVFLLPAFSENAPLPLYPGLEESAFAHEKALITKWPVRSAILAALGIEPGHTVWDLGSGSGSVAVEASCLAHRGVVIAVEKKTARAAHIAENRRRFGAANLEIMTGDMLSLMRSPMPGLPAPHRIFIGGGLGTSREKTEAILRAAWGALHPGGRLVTACVLLSSVNDARKTLEELGIAPEITMIQAAVSSPLGSDLRLQGGNPVFIISAKRR